MAPVNCPHVPKQVLLSGLKGANSLGRAGQRASPQSVCRVGNAVAWGI